MRVKVLVQNAPLEKSVEPAQGVVLNAGLVVSLPKARVPVRFAVRDATVTLQLRLVSRAVWGSTGKWCGKRIFDCK